MDSRERVLRSLNFEEPDRAPIDFWISPGARRRIETAQGLPLDSLLDAHDVDLRYIAGPPYSGPPLRGDAGDSTPDLDRDIWGVARKAARVQTPDGGTEVYWEVHHSPLATATTPEQILDYPAWPSPDWFDYSVVEAQCDRLRDKGRAVVFMGDRLNRIAQFKPAMYLRGAERILLDMIEAPDIAAALFGKIRDFYRAYEERILEAARGKIDILLTGDDFGGQFGPLVSEAMWIEFLGPGFAEYAAIARAHGAKLMHHTCGSVRPLIPAMIERGLDILQSLQPEAHDMAARELKEGFGDRLAFHGGMSIQRTMPHGSPEDVRAEVRDRFEALGKGGGYIFCTSHNIQADTPVENILALLQAYRDFGCYGG